MRQQGGAQPLLTAGAAGGYDDSELAYIAQKIRHSNNSFDYASSTNIFVTRLTGTTDKLFQTGKTKDEIVEGGGPYLELYIDYPDLKIIGYALCRGAETLVKGVVAGDVDKLQFATTPNPRNIVRDKHMSNLLLYVAAGYLAWNYLGAHTMTTLHNASRELKAGVSRWQNPACDVVVKITINQTTAPENKEKCLNSNMEAEVGTMIVAGFVMLFLFREICNRIGLGGKLRSHFIEGALLSSTNIVKQNYADNLHFFYDATKMLSTFALLASPVGTFYLLYNKDTGYNCDKPMTGFFTGPMLQVGDQFCTGDALNMSGGALSILSQFIAITGALPVMGTAADWIASRCFKKGGDHNYSISRQLQSGEDRRVQVILEQRAPGSLTQRVGPYVRSQMFPVAIPVAAPLLGAQDGLGEGAGAGNQPEGGTFKLGGEMTV
jgi:hypothetical protein